jgi:arylsulfatase A-like enzyme
MADASPTVQTPTGPKRAVVVLLDSLNRHHVGAYGGTEFETPNLDRLAARSMRFDRHYVGSLPCMPARHDLLLGALDFLWRPWGSVEVWEDAITYHLRRAGVTTMLVSDHPHLFETGGENYHTDFSAWDYVRGHEDDPWRTRPDPSAVGAPTLPDVLPAPFERGYDTSRTWFRGEADLPGPRTMAAAADWLDRCAPDHDRFLLVVDEFDPHEPFDTPEPWASRYDPDWEGGKPIWPPYVVGGIEKGVISEREGRALRAAYGGKVSMIDHHLGRVLDALDRHDLWDDTAFFLCTDHGHHLGEKDVWGKPGVPLYEVMSHVPLLVSWPGVEAGSTDALTTSVDLFATLCDLFGVQPEHRTHGRSMVPLLDGSARSIRDWVLMGVWGREVHVTDGTVKYARAPAGDNAPISMWSNRWSTMPIHAFPEIRLPRPDGRAVLDRMPGSDVPVIRQPFVAGDPLPYWAGSQFTGNHLWRVLDDPDEDEDRVGLGGASPAEEAEAADLLRAALDIVEAPDDQYARLGLT